MNQTCNFLEQKYHHKLWFCYKLQWWVLALILSWKAVCLGLNQWVSKYKKNWSLSKHMLQFIHSEITSGPFSKHIIRKRSEHSRGGHWHVRYCGNNWIFFTRYFSNFDFIWQCGIAVSSSLAFCGFSSFWLMVFRKRSFTVLWHYSFALWLLSNTDKYFLDYLRKITTQFLTLIYNEIGRAIPHPITGLFDHWLY